MPAQVQKANLGGLFAKVKKHKDAPIEYPQEFTDLPGDVTGVAQLSEMKLGVYKSGPNAGKRFWYAAAIVKEPTHAMTRTAIWDPKANGGKGGVVIPPESVKQIKIEGQRTSIMIPMCATKNKDGSKPVSEDEHMKEVANMMRILGGETIFDGVESDQDLLDLMAQMAAAGTEGSDLPPIYTKFKTRWKDPSKDYPTGGTWNHEWYGNKDLEDWSPPDTSDAETQDNSGAGEAPAQSTSDAASPPDDQAAAADGGDELSALIARCEAGDEEALLELQQKALAAGMSEEDYGAADFAGVAEFIQQAGAGAEAAAEPQAEPEPQEFEAVKGATYKYRLRDPKTGKPLVDPKTRRPRPGISCECLSVDKKTKTCTLKNLQDAKMPPIKGVKWDQLEEDL